MQRTDEKTKGLWGLVGGLARNTESAFEGLKREIEEEVGDTPKFKKVIPLEMFTSNDQKFYFQFVWSMPCFQNSANWIFKFCYLIY